MADSPPAAPIDPAEVARIYGEVAQRASKLFNEYLERQSHPTETPQFDEFGIGRAFMDLWASWLANPHQLANTQMDLFRDTLQLWQSSWMKAMGMPAQSVASPAASDNRFRNDDWQCNFQFDLFKQSYLIAARHIHESTSTADVTPEARKKIAFFTRQYIDALSPTNFALTNPAVVKETLASGGMNLMRGLNNVLKDLEAGGGQLRVKMVNDAAFKLGENVATAPGKVVYQNDLMQLIQYTPTTKRVLKEPLLIVPPWINKFYILDLRESNSFIRWAVGQGHTVFVISWVNPDQRLAHKTFEDYMLEGPLAALDAIGKVAPKCRVNTIGYCLGGTLLGSTLGYLAVKKDTRVNSATFFVALLDFSMPGELGVFIDEAQIKSLERRMELRGYLEGSEMAQTFNMLRANDLIWSFVINNYLLGREPMPFDLLYWNADSTRMPAKMHSFYLRNMYLGNKLREPGGIVLDGVPVDLARVKVPAYFISTAEDHIAPWASTYRGAQCLGGDVRFVLGQSGHIAGIVNPPEAKKYGYWTNPTLAADSAAWQQAATRHEGSWWPDWQAWIAARSSATRVPARTSGSSSTSGTSGSRSTRGTASLRVIEDAPGSYVRVRATDKAPTKTEAGPASRSSPRPK